MSAKGARAPIDVEPDWSSVLAICKKCTDGESTLPDRVKARMKECGSGEIRVLRSSCLDICPKHGVCASFIGSHGRVTAVFDADADADTVINYLTQAPNSATRQNAGPAVEGDPI